VTKRDLGPILGRGIRLRLLEPGDLERTLGWRNRDENRRWFVHSEPIRLEDHLRWFQGYQERSDDFVFVVEDLDGPGGLIGQASLYHIDWGAGCAEFGRLLIGESAARGRGLGLEVTLALLEYGFGTLEFKRVRLEVLAHNIRAIAIYHRCGFQPWPHETTEDLLTMELSREDWMARLGPSS
jgi:RimJ/RimL family protein N-acetyltransferase